MRWVSKVRFDSTPPLEANAVALCHTNLPHQFTKGQRTNSPLALFVLLVFVLLHGEVPRVCGAAANRFRDMPNYLSP